MLTVFLKQDYREKKKRMQTESRTQRKRRCKHKKQSIWGNSAGECVGEGDREGKEETVCRDERGMKCMGNIYIDLFRFFKIIQSSTQQRPPQHRQSQCQPRTGS